MKKNFNTGPRIMHQILYFLAVITFTLSGNILFSQNIQTKPTRQSSLEAFSKGDYEKAYIGFSELLRTYPNDPLYKYYSGVCLVKLNRDPEQALTFLMQAQRSSVVRTVPSDALFWLGRAQQLSGKFTDAITSYNTFTEQSGKKIARGLGVPEFIQQCNNKKGQIADFTAVPLMVSNKVQPVTEPVESRPEAVIARDQIIEKGKPANDTIPADFEAILAEAIDYQFKADSLYRITEEQKKNLDKLSYKGKTELKSEITEIENQAASFQKKADQKYTEAQTAMNAVNFTSEKIVENKVVLVADSLKEKNQVISAPVSEKVTIPVKDTIKVSKDTVQQKEAIKVTDNQAKKDSVAQPVKENKKVQTIEKSVELYSCFEAKSKLSDNADEKILVNASVPPGLIYRIQVAVFRNPVKLSYFKGLTPVYGFKVTGTDKTNYFVGMFRKLADAKKALLTVKQKGFKDAFIAAQSGGKAVSSERAAVLEKEWGKKPFIVVQSVPITPADTIPPTLSFRVEVTRSLKPVKDEILEGMKKMAGSRGLDTESLKDGTIIYLIGKFITFESAEEYNDLLKRNGYREAKVVAWLGKKEIPVETARQLFEKIE